MLNEIQGIAVIRRPLFQRQPLLPTLTMTARG
jgi:hypothetical protein